MTEPVADARVAWWTGAPFALAMAAAWVVLALLNPTTTYHFAPSIVAAAPQVARRLRAQRRLPPRDLAIGAGVGVVLALAATAGLAGAGALAGPTFFGTPHALAETLVVIAVGGVAATVFALRGVRNG